MLQPISLQLEGLGQEGFEIGRSSMSGVKVGLVPRSLMAYRCFLLTYLLNCLMEHSSLDIELQLQGAETNGGTWYRGQWRSAASLGTTFKAKTSAERVLPLKPPPGQIRQRRLQAISYNIGGMTQECYDLFKNWLQTRCRADVVLVQETHWGLGREDGRWKLPNWQVIVTADSKNRYCGLAVFIRLDRFSEEQISSVTWMPGRLLHVRCTSTKVSLDIVTGYQFVQQERNSEQVQQKRHLFWSKMGALLQGLPTRNLLRLGADLNTHCQPVPGHIGRGVMRTTKPMDDELVELVKERQLVLLNTWKSAAPSKCCTFTNNGHRSQIDFLVTRRRHADATSRTAVPIALDLAPWRLGPKHHAVQASLPWVPGWKVAPKTLTPQRFSLRALKQGVQEVTAEAQELQLELRKYVSANPECSLQDLNKNIYKHCLRLFPNKSRNHPTRTPADPVTVAADKVWRLSQIREAPAGTTFGQSAGAWSGYHALKQVQLQEAEAAASKNDLGAVYRVVNSIEIYCYFRDAFSSAGPHRMSQVVEPLSFTVDEVHTAIQQLKRGKADTLRKGWKQAVQNADFCQRLRTSCVFCGQWVSPLLIMAEQMEVDARATLAQQEIDLVFKPDKESEKTDKEADAEEARPPKWPKPEGKGSSQDGWDNWRSKKRNWGAARDQGWGQASQGSQVNQLPTTLTKAVLRHEADLQMWRTDTSFVIFVDTSPHSCLAAVRDAVDRWQELFIAGTVTMALKTTLFMGILSKLKTAVEELQTDENKIGRCMEAGWIKEGKTALDPAFVYHAWDTKNKQQVEAETPSLSLTTVLKHLDVALRSLTKEKAHCFAFEAPRIKPERGLLRMEAEEEQSFPGLGLGRPTPDEVAPRAARLRLRPALRLPQARLANPTGMNLCYANSALQAWSWLRELADSPESLQGSAQASAQILHAAHTVLLTDCLALHSVFRTWPELSRQHDVGEFWQHLVASWRLDAFAGLRVSLPHFNAPTASIEVASQDYRVGVEVEILDVPGDVHDDILEAYLLLNCACNLFIELHGASPDPCIGMYSINDLVLWATEQLESPRGPSASLPPSAFTRVH
ncbi:pola1 [Symbiodinium sp. CCMP2456]|nr:pola1 [Symbiodinium sp. CCMP2456]